MHVLSKMSRPITRRFGCATLEPSNGHKSVPRGRRVASTQTPPTRKYPRASTEEECTTSREEAMKKYLSLAKKRGGTKSEKKGKSSLKEAFEGSVMISIGKMKFDSKKMRGVADRSFLPIKVTFNKENTHSEVLQKCISQVWSDAPEGQCFLADGSGHKITGEDFDINIDGTETCVPWTINNYMVASGLKWPSRMRFYCVNMSAAACKNKEDEIQSGDDVVSTQPSAVTDSASQIPIIGQTIDVTTMGTSPPTSPPYTSQSIGVTAVNTSPPPLIPCANPPEGYFDVQFLEMVHSEYSSLVSLRSGMSQSSILSSRINDQDRMDEVSDSLSANPDHRIFPENPLMLGFYLDCVRNEKGSVYFISEATRLSAAQVIYKQPVEDLGLQVWTGCFASQFDRMTLLACPAINGYHSVANYVWEKNGVVVVGEDTPLFYCSDVGVFKCCVSALGQSAYSEFIVSEIDGVLSVKLQRCEEPVEEVPLSRQNENMSTISLVIEEELKSSLTNVKELKIIEEIGQGAFGRVYKAVWRGTIVAAKEIPTAGNQRILENELSVYRSLNHPNLLSLLGTINRPHSIILVTNYVRGKTLHSLIFDNSIELNFSKKVFICRQLCQGIVFMHTASPPVAHLDLKPENILVEDHSLHVFLADFGLGKVMTSTRVLGTATKSAGTPGFQSPEQLKGENMSISSDIYALGAVMTELFGGKPIWENMSSHTIILNVAIKGIMPNIDHLSQPVRDIVRGCLCPLQTRLKAEVILQAMCELTETVG